MKINKTHMLNHCQHVGRHSVSALSGVDMYVLDVDLDHRTLMTIVPTRLSTNSHIVAHTDGTLDLSTKLGASVFDGFAQLVEFCV
jgi:hypothetical protein